LSVIKNFSELISRTSLLAAWRKFSVGKWHQPAVREFWLNLEAELNSLHDDLSSGHYHPGAYCHFTIQDPKRRDIYVASVRDRLVHQLLYDYLTNVYEPKFYFHSYASRRDKGLERARNYFFYHYQRLSRTGCVWSAKLDIKRYFGGIDHGILLSLLARRVKDRLIFDLLTGVINSFGASEQGLPPGNLTSQIFANIYLQELDWQIKQVLKIKYYLRYNDDLIFLGRDHCLLLEQIKAIKKFVDEKLNLEIPREKIFIVSPLIVVDILGQQTNGQRRWSRPQSIRRAKINLERKFLTADEQFWDSATSYCRLFGTGMAVCPLDFA